MNFLSRIFFTGSFVLYAASVFSQDDLLSLVDDSKNNEPKKVYATFKTVRIGNAQTIETVKKNHLDFRIAHRFGNVYDANLKNPINETFQSYLGFDNATDIRISFDYGVLDNLSLGIGRSKFNKLLDGNLKWRILEQTSNFSMPISLAFYSSVGYSHMPSASLYAGVVKDFNTNELHRFNFLNQLIIASKISDWLSLEVIPSYLHRNFIREAVNSKNKAEDQNAFFSVGFGGRIKLTKRVSFIGDYFYNTIPFFQNNPSRFNPLALGFEIETGGHVFSLFVTNASALQENNYLPYTSDTWSKGQVKFGFCISRTFAL
jgi:hypothetical protein